MKTFLALSLIAVLVVPAAAQEKEPIVKWADWVSWGTAFVNPAWGVVEAVRGERKACHLGQMALSSGIAIGGANLLQRAITSPRPCCPGNGMPSAHAATSMVGLAQPSSAHGFSFRMTIGLGVAGGTAALRVAAHRHTTPQVLSGLLLGGGAELLGQLVRCD